MSGGELPVNAARCCELLAEARDAAHAEQRAADILADCPWCRKVGPDCEAARRVDGEWRHAVREPQTGDWLNVACGAWKLRDAPVLKASGAAGESNGSQS